MISYSIAINNCPDNQTTLFGGGDEDQFAMAAFQVYFRLKYNKYCGFLFKAKWLCWKKKK